MFVSELGESREQLASESRAACWRGLCLSPEPLVVLRTTVTVAYPVCLVRSLRLEELGVIARREAVLARCLPHREEEALVA